MVSGTGVNGRPRRLATVGNHDLRPQRLGHLLQAVLAPGRSRGKGDVTAGRQNCAPGLHPFGNRSSGDDENVADHCQPFPVEDVSLKVTTADA